MAHTRCKNQDAVERNYLAQAAKYTATGPPFALLLAGDAGDHSAGYRGIQDSMARPSPLSWPSQPPSPACSPTSSPDAAERPPGSPPPARRARRAAATGRLAVRVLLAPHIHRFTRKPRQVGGLRLDRDEDPCRVTARCSRAVWPGGTGPGVVAAPHCSWGAGGPRRQVTEENRLRSPVTASTRSSFTRGARTSTAPAAVVTLRGLWWAIAHNQAVALLVSAIRQLGHVGVDFGFQRGGRHPRCAVRTISPIREEPSAVVPSASPAARGLARLHQRDAWHR